MIINNKLIYTNYIESKENKGTIIITHGIAEYSNVYEDTANLLVKAGYNVMLYDVRGHGRSQGKRGHIKTYKTFLNDLDQIVNYVKEINQNVYLLGHSMGAMISLAYVLKYNSDNKVKGLITSGITINTPKQLNLFKYIPYKLLWFKRLKTNFSDQNLSNKQNSVNLDDQFNLSSFTFSLIGNILISQIKFIHNNLNKFNVPILLLHGSQDVITKPENSETLLTIINHDEKQLIKYKNSKHNLFNDLDSKKVVEDIINWLDSKK